MKRLAMTTAGLIGGVVMGILVMVTVQGLSLDGRGTETTVAETRPPPTTEPEPAPTAPGTTAAEPGFRSPPVSDQVLLVWTPGRLPESFADRVAGLPGVNAVTVVRSGLAHMTESRDAAGEPVDQPPDGFVIPLEVMAFDPATYTEFVTNQEAAAFTEILPDGLILGSTSARLRGIGPGGVVTFEDGSRRIVSAVVDDVVIGAAEAALPMGQSEALGIATERYLLIRYSGTRQDLESSIRQQLPDGVAVRIRAPGETPVLRHGDAVLPQVLIKEQFGEFAYRPGEGLSFAIEPGWVEENIVSAEVPLLGRVTCHRNLVPALAGAMAELEERNLGFLIDPDGYRGCFNPRYIQGVRGISRHAWGAAADINFGANPEGLDSTQDPRLLEVMERWGFTSGHEWLMPDPGHFEYIRPPVGGDG